MRIIKKITTAKLVIQNFGPLEILKILAKKANRFNHLFSNAGVAPFFQDKVRYTSPSEEFLFECGRGISKTRSLNGYENYLKRFEEHAKKPRNGFFQEIYDVGGGLGFVLFEIIDTEKPQKIIETGIAAGASSNLILDRLNANDFGDLISVDITSKVGELVEDKFKKRWAIKVLPKMFKRNAFLRILKSNQDAIIFLHDSDHSTHWQIFEISSVVNSIPGIKHILVDDVSFEFESYVLKNMPDWRLVVIDEGRKFSGYLARK